MPQHWTEVALGLKIKQKMCLSESTNQNYFKAIQIQMGTH